MVLTPLNLQSRLPQLQLPHKLEQAGIPFSFAGNTNPSRGNSGQISLPQGLPPGFPIELLMRGGSRNMLRAPTPTAAAAGLALLGLAGLRRRRA